MEKINLTLLIIAVFLVFTFVAENVSGEEASRITGTKKILVAYFSRTGNTREIANQIHKIVGGDIFEIQPVNPYPDDYNATVEQARQELDSGYKPALKTKIENISSYDVIFIGYPNWFSTIPAPVKTFLSEYDLSGKTVVPFCTHGGGGAGRGAADVAKLCPKSTLLDGIAIPGNDVKSAQNEVAEWLRRIKIAK